MNSEDPPDDVSLAGEANAVDRIRTELAKASPSDRSRLITKFVAAALSSIPWVGGIIGATVTLKSDASDAKTNKLLKQWLEEHTRKIGDLLQTLDAIVERFENLGPQIDERIQSEAYLGLVRRAFKAWDRADTEEKRRYVANVVSNSAGTRLSSDDVVRLFIDWLDLYHEAHFAVIREIYRSPGSTRYSIWEALYGDLPREDSAEADLYRFLIRDLSTGGVIRQDRETNYAGQFLKRPPRRHAAKTSTLESAFEDSKPYVLTNLGRQFVHYTMNEVVPRIEAL